MRVEAENSTGAKNGWAAFAGGAGASAGAVGRCGAGFELGASCTPGDNFGPGELTGAGASAASIALRMLVFNAATAADASGPVALMTSSSPCRAPKDISEIALRALAVRPCASMTTVAENGDAGNKLRSRPRMNAVLERHNHARAHFLLRGAIR